MNRSAWVFQASGFREPPHPNTSTTMRAESAEAFLMSGKVDFMVAIISIIKEGSL